MGPRPGLLAGALLGLLLAPATALAETDLVSRQAFEGILDVRAAGADGQPSFVDGGFGRTRFGGGSGGAFKGHAALADAALVWKPQLSWAIGAVVDVEYQQGVRRGLGLSEAYLTVRPTPSAGVRFSGRLGYFYPPISEEHEGASWSVANSLTPSAINTWVGEEVKVLGAEAKLSHDFGGQQLAATVGVFGDNDTSGTLLTFRGWGLHDLKAVAFTHFILPPLDPYSVGVQPPYTTPNLELDHRLGYYARLDWRPPGPAAFNAFYYDNNGDKESVNAELQWAWATRFWDLGASLDLDGNTRLLSQVMSGQTQMGFPNGRSVWYNLGFTSAYLLATHTEGRSAVTGRIEYFETRDRNFIPAVDDEEDNRGERGWALTGAYRFQVNPHMALWIEALHSRSKRPSLEEGGLEPQQHSTQIQTSLRVHF